MAKPRKRTSKERAEAYEQRIVLFLDFLGFGETVSASETDPKLLRRILSAFDAIKELADQTEFYKTQRITQFSDSLVVSYAVHERSSVFELIYGVAFILIRLVELGFLVRGAVTAGQLLHTQAYVVGPAMVEAYLLESKKAIYPRVIVAESVLEFARRFPSEIHDPKEEEKYVSDFLRVDDDGYRYVDYVSWAAVVATVGGDPLLYASYLQSLQAILKTGLASTEASVLEKYLWLHRQFTDACKPLDDAKEGSRFWLENQEVISDLSVLPRLERQARAAKKLVRKHQSQVRSELKAVAKIRKRGLRLS